MSDDNHSNRHTGISNSKTQKRRASSLTSSSVDCSSSSLPGSDLCTDQIVASTNPQTLNHNHTNSLASAPLKRRRMTSKNETNSPASTTSSLASRNATASSGPSSSTVATNNPAGSVSRIAASPPVKYAAIASSDKEKTDKKTKTTSPPSTTGVNFGVEKWNQTRAEWVKHSTNKERPPMELEQVDIQAIMMNFRQYRAFPAPLPLATMVEILNVLWEEDAAQ